jgi:hypothetical protein
MLHLKSHVLGHVSRVQDTSTYYCLLAHSVTLHFLSSVQQGLVKTSFFFGHKQFARSSGVHPHLVVLNQSGVINNYDLEDYVSSYKYTKTFLQTKNFRIFDTNYRTHYTKDQQAD